MMRDLRVFTIAMLFTAPGILVLPSAQALQLQLPSAQQQQSRREYFGDVLMGGFGLATSASLVPPAYADPAKVSQEFRATTLSFLRTDNNFLIYGLGDQ
jgi:hypothetical protein